MFHIISTGWACARWVLPTLWSVELQSREDWQMHVVVDPSDDDTADVVREWMQGRGDRWLLTENSDRRYAVRNQVEGIRAMRRDPDDVIVWLDLDGDRFAHKDVLARVAEVYEDPDVWLTYGSFRPVPDIPECMLAEEIPVDVVARRSYREETLAVNQHWNHLRTMRSKLFDAIPDDQFRWENGEWYDSGSDYIIMTAALELAGDRHRFLPETLYLYNHYYDPATVSERNSADCTLDFLHREPLAELPR